MKNTVTVRRTNTNSSCTFSCFKLGNDLQSIVVSCLQIAFALELFSSELENADKNFPSPW